MSIYENVLIGCDGSSTDKQALSHGACLALAIKAHVHLLLVSGIYSSMDYRPDFFPHVALGPHDEVVRETLQQGLEWLASQGVSAHGHVAFGSMVSEVARWAADLRVDLVVVCHRPRQRIVDWFVGSESVRLLNLIPCDLLVVGS
ncbi:universal stress protein [Burkholderia ubonensis]|uniref:universal stress protein n=1 Tax=Burkholderia ubonensis TaxID=101571 RepID=UPI0012F821FD|nr:universal stress protein [Burkholderia ubonensis]